MIQGGSYHLLMMTSLFKLMMTSLFKRKEILEGALIPWGYGVSWMRWDRPVAVCHVIPLNVIVSGLRQLWIWVRRVGSDHDIRVFGAGYSQGYAAALEHRNTLTDVERQRIEIDACHRLLRLLHDAAATNHPHS